MKLSYSRALYLEFFFDQTTENFLRGHVHAFQSWNGQPRVVLYDNLKSAVLERRGNQILNAFLGQKDLISELPRCALTFHLSLGRHCRRKKVRYLRLCLRSSS